MLLRKQEREKQALRANWFCLSGRECLLDCVTRQRHLSIDASTTYGCNKNYENLILYNVDDVMIPISTLEYHIERLDEVITCIEQAGLKRIPSKCEILRDFIKYLGRLVVHYGVRPDHKAVEAVLTWREF